MNLKVMMKPMHNGELTPMLCDDMGEPLPGQVRIDISTALDDTSRVTVEFRMIEFADGTAIDARHLGGMGKPVRCPLCPGL